MKYISLLLIMFVSVGLLADDGTTSINPSEYLDTPVKNTPSSVFKLELVDPGTHSYTAWWHSNATYRNRSFNGTGVYSGSRSVFNGSNTVFNILTTLQNVLAGVNNRVLFDELGDATYRTNVEGSNAHWSYVNFTDSQSTKNKLSTALNEILGFPNSSENLAMSVSPGDTSYVDEVGQQYNSNIEEYYSGLDAQNTYNMHMWVGRDTAVGSGSAHQMSLTYNNTKFNIFAYGQVTPLVLDLNKDNRLETKKGMVAFDINGDGFEEIIEWVGPNDGILLRYTEGKAVTGLDMFGSPGGFANGFEKLSALDANNDQKITGAELSGLSVWQDKNQNAKVDAGEIFSLASLNITSLSTTHNNLVSSFVQNNQTYTMWDWLPNMFMVKKVK